MKTFFFQGCGDDTFGEYGLTNIDHCDPSDRAVIKFDLVASSGEGVRVSGQYMDNGCWQIGVHQLDEDNPVGIDWVFAMFPSRGNGYQNALVVGTPDNVDLHNQNNT